MNSNNGGGGHGHHSQHHSSSHHHHPHQNSLNLLGNGIGGNLAAHHGNIGSGANMNSLSGGLGHGQPNNLQNLGGLNNSTGANTLPNLSNLLIVQQLLSSSIPQLQNPAALAAVAAAANGGSSGK